MAGIFEFVAESRESVGKSVARAIRRDGKLPAIVYGGGVAPQWLVLGHNDVIEHLGHEAVYSHILHLKIDGKTQKAVLKEVQRHPAKAQILHLDFLRVDEKHILKTRVPLHFINEDVCVGVKMGGVVTHAMVDVEVSCLPLDLPEYMEVDLATLELGDAIHLTDINVPEGVTIVALAQDKDRDHTVAQVMKIRITDDDEDDKDDEGDEDDKAVSDEEDK